MKEPEKAEKEVVIMVIIQYIFCSKLHRVAYGYADYTDQNG